ncbi:MAG: peptidoglycan-binding protein [Clostridiales bacterium]|nr:peptidoglycan-binding protein [Clostridiales bacterium]
MNKAKKFIAGMLTAAVMMAGSAFAAGIERAAMPVPEENLKRYPSYTCDEATGKWTVRTNQADGLMDRFWTYGKANSVALCAFDLELEGNGLTGVITPVLRFYYMDGLEINATAVSILVGDTRYDLAAASDEVMNDRYAAERISAPLTREAMALVDALLNTDTASVRLIGDRIYTFELDLDTTNTRRRIEAASLNGIESAAALLDEAGMNGFGLWDLSAAAWETEYGFAPAFARSTVVKTIGETAVTDDFGMVMRNDQTRAAKAAQEVLIENGFMSGTATSTFGQNSSAAARRAQHYLGMIETGCMDAQLAEALAQGVSVQQPVQAELTELGGKAAVSVDRYWFANGITAANAGQCLYTVSNSDNVFIAADGLIRNISGQEMRLFTQVDAKVVYNDGYEFEANVVCERDGGASLDMIMLPMAESRLIVYAEIPARLAAEQDASWRIVLTVDGESLEYELQ